MPRSLPLIILLLVALAVRLGFVLSPYGSMAGDSLPDQREYLDLGRSLLNGQGLSMVDTRFSDVVRAFRMPGYPLFVAACGGRETIVRVVQALLDASTVLAAILIARRWLSQGVALVAGVFVALDPIQVFFTSLILSETVFTALLAWGVVALIYGRSPLSAAVLRKRLLWLAGVLLLIAGIYIRPSAMAFPIFLVLAAGIVEARDASFVPAVRRWPVVAITVLLTVAALLPWAIRNKFVLDRWIFTTTNDGFTLYDGWNRGANGSSDQSSLANLPLLTNLSETQRSDYLRDLAVRDLQADPMHVVRLVPTKLARTWSPWPLSDQFGRRMLYVIVAACHAIPLFVLALVGFFVRDSLPRSAKFLLLVPALLITIMHAMSIGSLRYRMPIHPELAVLAAAAFGASRLPEADRVE